MRRTLIISAIAAAATISTVALSGEPMANSTRQDILAAMKSEAFAYLKYTLFAEQARKKRATTFSQASSSTPLRMNMKSISKNRPR